MLAPPDRRQLRGDAEPDSVQALGPRQLDRVWEAQRGGVARVVTDHVLEQQRRVGHVAGQRTGLVERGGERDHPVARNRTVGGFEPDDPAQCGRLADRAARVRPQRPRRETRGDGGGAPARGASGHARSIPRVEHRPERRVLVRGAHRELVLVGLAQQTARRPPAIVPPLWPCMGAHTPPGCASPTGSARPRCRTDPSRPAALPPAVHPLQEHPPARDRSAPRSVPIRLSPPAQPT